MSKTLLDVEHEQKLFELRIKWSKAKEAEDEVMMKVIERMAKAVKIGAGLEK